MTFVSDTPEPAMTRLTAKDFPQQLLDYYDYYAHGKITKREFLELATKYAVGGLTALALFDLLKPDYALAEQVLFTDPDILPEYITYPSPNGHGEVRGYLVKPAKASGKVPAVVVVHENRGLNPYIEDVARRVAKAGYIALAPDGLMHHKDATGKVGMTGFCYGGGVANAAAVAYPELAAAVPFYGRQPPAQDAEKVKAPLLLHFAELDTRINEGWPAWEAALKKAGKTYEAHIYPGVNHGFHNDSTPRYDKAAAELAWQRTLAWFEKYLH